MAVLRRLTSAPALALALALASCSPPPAPLEKFYQLPDVSLVHHNGKPMKLSDLHGKVAIYDFIFTSCRGMCPTMTKTMQELYEGTPEGWPVRFVSISVDPVHDTPAVLAAYAKPFRRNKRWLFLTGNRDDIIRLSVDGFKLAAGAPGSPQEPILHSSRFVLVDRNGWIRGYYDSLDKAAMERLQQDVRLLVSER